MLSGTSLSKQSSHSPPAGNCFDPGVMAGLQNNLADLHACLQGDDPASNAHKAHNIVGDIGHYCLQDVTDKDIGLYD